MSATAPRTQTIPVLDLGPFLAGEAGALDSLAAALRDALVRVGFFFVRNHGIPWALIEAVYAEARRFHALPLEEKLRLRMSRHNTGYVPLGASISRASQIAAVKRPNVNAAFFMKRDRAPDDPDVRAGILFRGLNQWPEGLPGFRDTLRAYFETMEAFAHRLLPLYARPLDLPPDWFDTRFDQAQITLRLSHYPPVSYEDDEFGLAPHTDAGFMTLLPANDVDGLEIRPRGWDWMPAPRLPEAFLVNSGDILKRWTNDRFLSTEHRVRNPSGRDRYAIPFFFDPRTDIVIECLPTCAGPGDPPRYPPITYETYLAWFMSRNYHGAQDTARP